MNRHKGYESSEEENYASYRSRGDSEDRGYVSSEMYSEKYSHTGPIPARYSNHSPIYSNHRRNYESDSDEYSSNPRRNRIFRRKKAPSSDTGTPSVIINNKITTTGYSDNEDKHRPNKHDLPTKQTPAPPVSNAQPQPPPPPSGASHPIPPPSNYPDSAGYPRPPVNHIPPPPIGVPQPRYPLVGFMPAMPGMPNPVNGPAPYDHVPRPRSRGKHRTSRRSSSTSSESETDSRSTRRSKSSYKQKSREELEQRQSMELQKSQLEIDRMIIEKGAEAERAKESARLRVMEIEARMRSAHNDRELQRLRQQLEEQTEKDRREKERLEKEELNLARQKLDEIKKERERQEERARQAETDRLRHAQEELERIQRQKELDDLRRRNAKEEEYRQAKERLDEMARLDEEREREKRIEESLELRRRQKMEEEQRIKEEKETLARLAVEQYKQEQLLKKRQEEERRKEIETEVNRHMHQKLVASGLDAKAIEAILKGQKVETASSSDSDSDHDHNPHRLEQTFVLQQPTQPQLQALPVPAPVRPTYTRMSRKYVSMESLNAMKMEFFIDPQDPSYVIITREVPEWEQNYVWQHTKSIRAIRQSQQPVAGVLPYPDDEEEDEGDSDYGRTHRTHYHRSRSRTRHYRSESRNSSSRKKDKHSRNKSPSLLMYMAGAR